MRNEMVKNMTLAAMFMAIGLLLPLLTMQIPQIGNMMLPMHIPVLLCGLICGWKYGLVVGLILPGFRYLVFGMPPIFAPFPPFHPIMIPMIFELATYGFLAGFLYQRSRWQCVIALYRSMIIAMVGGRIVLGIVMALHVPFVTNNFTWTAFIPAFIGGAFTMAIPGIIVQLTLIPAIMVALNRSGLVKFRRSREGDCGDSL